MAQQRHQHKKSKRLAPFPSQADLHTWAAELDAVAAALGPRFERAEPRQRALAYLTGLLTTAERKNGWALPEMPGGARPTGVVRLSVEERQQPFVLAVPSTKRVGLSATAAGVAASWPAAAWQRLAAGAGSQGPRLYDWAWMPMPWRAAPAGMAHWLLARRSLSHPDELAYYFVFGPAASSLEQVAQVAGTRWQVEQAFELAKQEVGLDGYEVRHWTGWYRHITLAMLALAHLTVVRRHAREAAKGGASHRKKALP